MAATKKSKLTLRVLAALFFLFLILSMTGITIVYLQQDKLVGKLVEQLNHDFQGRIAVRGSHISPFRNFPYISVDFEDISIYEGKDEESELILHVADTYVGFDFWTVLNGTYDIKAIKLDSGFLKLVQHTDGTFNIANALSGIPDNLPEDTVSGSSFHLDLKAIELIDIDLLKLNEANNVLVEAFINAATSRFRMRDDRYDIFLDSRFLFNLIIDNDTSFLHDKHVNLHTTLNYDDQTGELMIRPSELLIEKALFSMEGDIGVNDDMDLDLKFTGNKPNFDLFLAFAPPELTPLLGRYDNGGQIYFNADIQGKSINGFNPQIEIDFGCAEAFVHNTDAGKEVNDLYFKGHFTNGAERLPSTMELSIQDISAKPETGLFDGNVVVKNFDSPDIDMQLKSEFDLDFLANFLEIRNLEDVTGFISLEMNFHDIIDLSQPEKSIEKLNESYFTELIVNDLSFNSSTYNLPVRNVNIHATMDGHAALIKQLELNVGSSDLSIEASISDLPAILHHTDQPVDAILDIRSGLIDLKELTYEADSSGFDEQLRNLSMRFKFKSTARNFTESPHLPMGEFFIEQLQTDLTHYPHQLHDFNADIFIDETNFRVIDFTGMLDESDFHFNGTLENYGIWFERNPVGETIIDFDLVSDLIQLDDVFAYGGENYVPEDYRHEEFRNLKFHGRSVLNFKQKLASATVSIDHFGANMKVHRMRFDDFGGEFYQDSVRVEVRDFGGTLGNSEFRTNLVYHLDSGNTEPHSFRLTSDRLDFDQLFAYNPPPTDTSMTPEDHEAGFNLFEVPFQNLTFDFDIKHLNYHRYLFDDVVMQGRMQTDHHVYLDTLAFATAGGSVGMNGHFNGSDPAAIYFSPDLVVRDVDLDKLLFKFENFGQDHLVSENLHGKLSGNISGKIHMHADMIPIIDDSELHLDFKVLNGSLNNFTVFHALSDYFANKNLDYVRFDTLQNKLDLKNGELTIPSMNINSSLGYFEISGTQHVSQEMEYFVRIPLKVITRAGFSKLFGNKDQDTSDQVDEIEYRDESKKTRFLNLKIEGTPEDYTVKVAKKKEL